MSNKAIAGIVVGLIVIGGLAWWGLSSKNTVNVSGDTASTTAPTSLTVNHYFEEGSSTPGFGSHTIEGTMTLPTPCHTLTTEATVTPGVGGEQDAALVAFATHQGEGVCTEVLADKFFRVSFTASKDAKISATLDGKPITLIFSENKEGITK